MSFGKQEVSYQENRADDGFGWDVNYDLSMSGRAVEIDLRVKLVGDDPGRWRQVWEDGVNDIWIHRAFLASATELYEIQLDFGFVSGNEHQTVQVHAENGHWDMENFYLEDAWGPAYADESAAHEIGHMLGSFDEYEGGATFDNFTTTAMLMSDLTQGGFEKYFWTVEYYAKLFENVEFGTVLAKRGSSKAEQLTGDAGMNGIYGFGGSDTIRLKAGNDMGFGGSGDDKLYGGSGNDDLTGNSGKDAFVFDTTLSAKKNVDVIEDFSTRDDLIWIDEDIFGKVGKTGQLSSSAFHASSKGLAHDKSDRVIYDKTNGALLYDADGKGGADAVKFALLDDGLRLTSQDFLVIA